MGEVADIIGGGTPSTLNLDYWDGNIDWYSPAEIIDQIYVYRSQRKITELGFEKSSAKMLPEGTVLFTSRAGIGKTAILAKRGCTNQGFQSIVPYSNKLDSYFIFSRTEELKKYGELVGAGSTFVEVSGRQMGNMQLMIPKTIGEQHIIGLLFSTLDHLITLHRSKFFGDILKTIASYALYWEQRKLGDYLEVSEEKNLNNEYTKENVLSVSGDVGIVNQIEFQGRSFAGILVNNYGVVKTGYVVYTKSPLKNNPYGIIKANKGRDGIVSTLYAIYKPKVNVNSNFIQIYFEQNARMNNYMQPLVNKGAKNDMKISSENALKGNVIFPIRIEQDIIVDFFFKIDHLITLHQLEPFQMIFKAIAYRIIDYAKSKPPRYIKYEDII